MGFLDVYNFLSIFKHLILPQFYLANISIQLYSSLDAVLIQQFRKREKEIIYSSRSFTKQKMKKAITEMKGVIWNNEKLFGKSISK